MDATNKAYANSAIRDNEMSMRAYMDMFTRDGKAVMNIHYTVYFDNANAEMGKIVEKINSVHYVVVRDITGIIANIIPSVVKTMVLELVRENDMLIADLKTKFDSFTPQVVSIQKEILTKIPNSIKPNCEADNFDDIIRDENFKIGEADDKESVNDTLLESADEVTPCSSSTNVDLLQVLTKHCLENCATVYVTGYGLFKTLNKFVCKQCSSLMCEKEELSGDNINELLLVLRDFSCRDTIKFLTRPNAETILLTKYILEKFNTYYNEEMHNLSFFLNLLKFVEADIKEKLCCVNHVNYFMRVILKAKLYKIISKVIEGN
ncbi:hypothetical protein FQA39_LY09165 [Lamprigera yunnana]|nr:hypothetical protein FQA39_LY09165 [Lamprigera yunnana]